MGPGIQRLRGEATGELKRDTGAFHKAEGGRGRGCGMVGCWALWKSGSTDERQGDYRETTVQWGFMDASGDYTLWPVITACLRGDTDRHCRYVYHGYGTFVRDKGTGCETNGDDETLEAKETRER